MISSDNIIAYKNQKNFEFSSALRAFLSDQKDTLMKDNFFHPRIKRVNLSIF